MLWQKIVATGDEASAAAARQQLYHRRAELDKLADTRFAAAKQTHNTDGLLQLTEAFPQKRDLRLELAAAYAAKRDAANAVRQLAQANKLGLNVATVMARPEFYILLESEGSGGQFTRFIEEAFGADALTAMREECLKQRAQLNTNRRIADLGLDLVRIAPGKFTMAAPTVITTSRPSPK